MNPSHLAQSLLTGMAFVLQINLKKKIPVLNEGLTPITGSNAFVCVLSHSSEVSHTAFQFGDSFVHSINHSTGHTEYRVLFWMLSAEPDLGLACVVLMVK
jgi:hypothetical protein